MIGQNRGQPVSTVYIVDNDRAMRESLAWLLESAGIAARTFGASEAFLAACPGDTPGCAVLDIRLPGMSGVGLQQEMARRGHRIPVIFITGFADVTTAVRVLKDGAFDFIEKPFAEQLILERVRQAIELDAVARRVRAERDRLAEMLGRLTSRERAVFDQVVHGKANKVMAYEFGISEKTVEAHRARVMQKLGARSLAELVRMDLLARQTESLRLRWVAPPVAGEWAGETLSQQPAA